MKVTVCKYLVDMEECGQFYIEKSHVYLSDYWAIRDGFGRCLSDQLTWDYEGMPSERNEEFLLTHRFNLDKARFLCYSLESVLKSKKLNEDNMKKEKAKKPSAKAVDLPEQKEVKKSDKKTMGSPKKPVKK